MVIGDLLIVDDPAGLSGDLQARRKWQSSGHTGSQFTQLGLHIMGQISAVRAGIGQKPFFIQGLCIFQCLLRCVSKIPVGIPLKRGQVIQQGWILCSLVVLHPFDHSAVMIASIHKRPGLIQVLHAFRMSNHTMPQIQLHRVKGFRLKIVNRRFPLRQHGQGRRHDATDVKGRAIQQRIMPGGVHPDQPVGLRPA